MHVDVALLCASREGGNHAELHAEATAGVAKGTTLVVTRVPVCRTPWPTCFKSSMAASKRTTMKLRFR